MNEEELREIIKAKNKPIRDVVELSKHFRGRRNCIVFLTESFRIDLDNKMSRLAMLKVENEKLRKEIEETKSDLKYMLEQTRGAFEDNWCIDWNFTEIREKYKLGE